MNQAMASHRNYLFMMVGICSKDESNTNIESLKATNENKQTKMYVANMRAKNAICLYMSNDYAVK